MSIVSSTHVVGTPQADGRSYVVETHTDDLGAVYLIEYGPVGVVDYVAIRTARAIALATQLADQEFAGVILGAALVLQRQTLTEFAARFWARVQFAIGVGDKLTFGRLMWWLTERLVAGDLTDNQARVSFNTAYGRSLTSGQWTTLRSSRITPAHDRWAAMQAESDL